MLRSAETIVEIQDRVTNELPRPVVRDVATTLDRH
jgi:hypothetical protein